jgi:predicted DCC family thiol-disulfide oxidoreductase YuxK
MKDSAGILVCYDGVCNLCNWFVRYIIKRDKPNTIQFISIQNAFSKGLLYHEEVSKNSVIVIFGGKTYFESTAVIKVLGRLGGFWTIINIAYIFPKFLRDAIYRFIAKRRYRLFGRTKTCQLPDESIKNRFVDYS